MDAISLLNTGFIICLVGAILFFVLSVILFFVFDIKSIFMIRTGRAQAKTVKEMESINASTGRLISGKAPHPSEKKKKNTGKLKNQPVIQPPVAAPAVPEGQPAVTEEIVYDSQDTAAGGYTEPLAPEDSGQTSLLQPEQASETTVLSEAEAPFDSVPVNKNSDIYFDVIKKIICRDTEEVIW